MNGTQFVTNLSIAAAAAFGATKVMEAFNMVTFKKVESERDRRREEEVRPGPPYEIAARKVLGAAGIHPDEKVVKRAGLAFHYGAGLSWTPVYVLLRRRLGWNPVAAGLVTGASQSLILDETITPLLGFSAPNRAYPVSTHVRAFVAHLVYGLAMAGVFEVGWKVLGRRA